MKHKLLIFLFPLMFAAYSYAQQIDILRGMVTDAQGKPLQGVLLSVPQADLADIETDAQGVFMIGTSAAKGVKKDETLVLVFHSNEYRIVGDDKEKDLVFDPMNNVISVKTAARAKTTGIRVQMERKENVLAVTQARNTPNPEKNFEVQIASLATNNPDAEKYYETALKMPVNKHYRDGKLILTVPANSEAEARTLQAQINAKKIKGINGAFLVAVESVLNTQYYRIQLKASPTPISEAEKKAFNAKLALHHSYLVEVITEAEDFKYKYYVADIFGEKNTAIRFQKQLAKVGLKSFVHTYNRILVSEQ